MDLLQGRNGGAARPMVVIKREKSERAANYARVMQVWLGCTHVHHTTSTGMHMVVYENMSELELRHGVHH